MEGVLIKHVRCAGIPAGLAVACLVVMMLASPLAAPGFAATAPIKHVEAQVRSTSSYNDAKITACDIDGCGKDELLAGTMDGHMYCFTPAGKVKWVKYVGAAIRGGAACYDVDGDGKREVFFGDMNGVVWGLGCNGVTLTQWGWPKQTVRAAQYVGVYATPAIGDINGDGVSDIVVGCYGHYVYAWTYTGAILPGWPVQRMPRSVSAFWCSHSTPSLYTR